MSPSFSSFLTSQAHSLLDLSLYVTSDNYATTRTAYSSILQWPTQYFIPPQLRVLAKARTEHLGLSSLDLATLEEDRRSSSRKAGGLIPQSLRTSRQTVTGLVREKQSSARFKLDALVDAAFAPLQQLLGGKKWMLSDEKASSLDCLALGYLSLALLPDLPQSWLAEGLQMRYPDLCRFVEDGVKTVFGGKVTAEDALPNSARDQSASSHQGRARETALPWTSPERSIGSLGTNILNNAFDSLPLISKRSYILTSSSSPPPPHTTDTPPHTLFSTLLPPLLASASAVALIASYLAYSSSSLDDASQQSELEKKNRSSRLSDMGEAGAVFAGLDFGAPRTSEGRVPTPPAEDQEGRVPVGVAEVDVEGVGQGIGGL